MRWDKAARLAGSWSKARRPPVFLRIRQDLLPLGVGEGPGVAGSQRGLGDGFIVIAGVIQPCLSLRVGPNRTYSKSAIAAIAETPARRRLIGFSIPSASRDPATKRSSGRPTQLGQVTSEQRAPDGESHSFM